MTRYVLDTSIISNVTKSVPSEALVVWMADQPDEDLFITSLTVAEIKRGLLEKPAGKKRRDLLKHSLIQAVEKIDLRWSFPRKRESTASLAIPEKPVDTRYPTSRA